MADSIVSVLVEQIEKVVDEKVKRNVEASSTERSIATVVETDLDGTIWVHLEGGLPTTPVTGSSASVVPGQKVNVINVGGKLYIDGNYTSPGVGTVEHKVLEKGVENATVIAEEALTAADVADKAAYAAQESANEAAEAASNASTSAQEAAEAAATADEKAVQAANAAATADEKAVQAASAASSAQSSANTANTAANSALMQLSNVEDVIGVVNWVTDHGTYSLTSDTTVQENKVYYTRSDTEPYVYTIVAEPVASGLPSYYELSIDTALSNYVASHLALTNAGLFVLNDSTSYKMLLAATGMQVQDANGNAAVTYGPTGTSFADDKQFYIGSNDAYILFTPASGSDPATITIGGAHVQIGSGKTLSELIGDVQHATDSCVLSLTSTNGTVFKSNTGVSTTLNVRIFVNDGTIIENKQALSARYGAGSYLQWKWKDAGDADFSILLSNDPRITRDGFSLTVSPSDISTQAVINCELVY